MAQENLKPYLAGISHCEGKALTISSLILPSSLSKPRRSLEASKNQAKRSLEYACSMNKVFLCVPLVVRSELEEVYECHVLTNMRENDDEVGFVASRNYVHRPMSQCLLWTFNFTIGGIVYKCLIQLSLNEVLALLILILSIIIVKAYSYGK